MPKGKGAQVMLELERTGRLKARALAVRLDVLLFTPDDRTGYPVEVWSVRANGMPWRRIATGRRKSFYKD